MQFQCDRYSRRFVGPLRDALGLLATGAGALVAVVVSSVVALVWLMLQETHELTVVRAALIQLTGVAVLVVGAVLCVRIGGAAEAHWTSMVELSGQGLDFTLVSRHDHRELNWLRIRVRTPCGATYEHTFHMRPGTGARISAAYPQRFRGDVYPAPPATPGRYDWRWEGRRGDGDEWILLDRSRTVVSAV